MLGVHLGSCGPGPNLVKHWQAFCFFGTPAALLCQQVVLLRWLQVQGSSSFNQVTAPWVVEVTLAQVAAPRADAKPPVGVALRTQTRGWSSVLAGSRGSL